MPKYKGYGKKSGNPKKKKTKTYKKKKWSFLKL